MQTRHSHPPVNGKYPLDAEGARCSLTDHVLADFQLLRDLVAIFVLHGLYVLNEEEGRFLALLYPDFLYFLHDLHLLSEQPALGTVQAFSVPVHDREVLTREPSHY
jgi:hypothetical protein